MVFRVILLIIYILTILSIILVEHKNAHEALLWTIVVTVLPYAGIFFYLIFGNTVNIKLTRLMRSRRLKNHSDVQAQYNNMFSTDAAYFDTVLSQTDERVAKFNYTYNDSVMTAYDSAKLLISGKTHYKTLFADLRAAKDSIHAEFFTIHNDSVGKEFIDILAKKAAEGVKVTLICDFLANFSYGKKLFKPLIKAGGYVKKVKKTLTHFRSHRKIVTIDGEIAYIGGMNIGTRYCNAEKKKSPWRDTQIRLTGACVSVLENYVNLDTVCSMRDKEYKAFGAACRIRNPKTPQSFSAPCQFIIGGADTDKESIKMCYLSMIRNAQHSIRIQSPYFIPDISILDELKTACASGIRVELMLPLVKPSAVLEPVSNYYAGELAKYGAVIYKYKGYMHAKTLIIDNELCCIGSVNMDIRSFEIDDEICGVFYNNELVKKYNLIYNHDISDSVAFDYESFNKRGLFQRLKEKILLLFSPLM